MNLKEQYGGEWEGDQRWLCPVAYLSNLLENVRQLGTTSWEKKWLRCCGDDACHSNNMCQTCRMRMSGMD